MEIQQPPRGDKRWKGEIPFVTITLTASSTQSWAAPEQGTPSGFNLRPFLVLEEILQNSPEFSAQSHPSSFSSHHFLTLNQPGPHLLICEVASLLCQFAPRKLIKTSKNFCWEMFSRCSSTDLSCTQPNFHPDPIPCVLSQQFLRKSPEEIWE